MNFKLVILTPYKKYFDSSVESLSLNTNNGEITINPIPENLDTPNVLKNFDYGEIRNLYDWIKIKLS